MNPATDKPYTTADINPDTQANFTEKELARIGIDNKYGKYTNQGFQVTGQAYRNYLKTQINPI